MSELRIFGLLHIKDNEKLAINLKSKNFNEQISVYLNNAITLSRSLHLKGVPYVLLTNEKALIESILQSCGNTYPLQVTEIPFITKVPTGISFYSAHFKLDALRYLGTLNGGYNALCDLDMVCINDLPTCLRNVIQADIPLFYDISDQVIPAYGHEAIIKDLTTIGGMASEGRWAGGEFISGPSHFFSRLVEEIDIIYDDYIANINSLHHVGDEAFTSAALERLRRGGLHIADAGAVGIVGRYWSNGVSHPQRPFKYFSGCFLLHLPADKDFISQFARREDGEIAQFGSSFGKHAKSLVKLAKRMVKEYYKLKK
jgi:hypothetical protein